LHGEEVHGRRGFDGSAQGDDRVVRRDRQGRVRPRRRAGLLQRRRHQRCRGQLGEDPEGERLIMALQVSLVSAEAELWSGEASLVVAKTVEGEIGFMPGHEPTLAVLAAGQVRITQADGTKVVADASDGFVSMELGDALNIVAGTAKLVS